ncbi:hypothetical protein L1987_53339 [Smallanthus sonchifolius]|uniref:Uncharacterized protein n=1 Tax=Smallanthus sonchifolius TaxID=185202 RepID=A0ACB9EWU1_9ASTR|nr:hypothetical protein L1987_53339 [Smallanthus sonchifolius]
MRATGSRVRPLLRPLSSSPFPPFTPTTLAAGVHAYSSTIQAPEALLTVTLSEHNVLRRSGGKRSSKTPPASSVQSFPLSKQSPLPAVYLFILGSKSSLHRDRRNSLGYFWTCG